MTSPRATVAVLCLVQFVDVLGVGTAITAIPAMISGLRLGESAAGLIATMYAMFFGGLLIFGARLGDRFGHRRVLLIGIGLFVVVSVVGGSSTGLVQLLISRALQGSAAAISVPSALRLLLEATPNRRNRDAGVAAWSAVGAAAGTIGLLVGGILTQTLGWPSVFWINAPVGAFLFVATLVVVPTLTPDRTARGLDVAGAGLLIGAVMCVVLGASLSERASTRVGGVGFLAGGILLTVAFLWRQRTARSPLIPPTALASRNLRLGAAISFTNTATTSGSSVLATLYLQDHLHASPLAAGLTITALSVGAIAGSALSSRLARSLTGDRRAVLGLSGIAVGNLMLVATFGLWWGIGVGAGAIGLGLGVASVAATSIATSVPGEISGSASGILNTGAQLGTALGTAALIVVAGTGGLGPISGFAAAWAIAVIGAAAAAVWVAFRKNGGVGV